MGSPVNSDEEALQVAIFYDELDTEMYERELVQMDEVERRHSKPVDVDVTHDKMEGRIAATHEAQGNQSLFETFLRFLHGLLSLVTEWMGRLLDRWYLEPTVATPAVATAGVMYGGNEEPTVSMESSDFLSAAQFRHRGSAGSRARWYAVVVGRKPGLYTSWERCKCQVDGFSGALHKSFRKLEEAEQWLDANKHD